MKTYLPLSIPLILTLSCMITIPVIAGLFDRPDFFEQGQDQFEEEIRRFESGESIPDFNLQIDDSALSWSPVVIKAAGFTAMMPSGAITHEAEIVEGAKGDINFDIIATHPSSSRYVGLTEKVGNICHKQT